MMMPMGKGFCLQAKEIVNRVYNYFAKLHVEWCYAGRGTLKEDIGRYRFVSSVCSLALLLKVLRPTCDICVGIAKRMITSIQQEASCGSTVVVALCFHRQQIGAK